MHRFRLSLLAALSFLLIVSGFSVATAQDATPDPAATPYAPVSTPGGTLPNSPNVELVKVADGLVDPINVASPDDGSGRVFVVERVGMIRIVDKDGNLLPDPFLDISDRVKTDFLEQGLLGLAFHPDFANNGLFYVYYNDYQTTGDNMLVEFHVSANDPNMADPDSGRLLLTQDKPFVNHNGGTIKFGPDGYLYIAMGDGGLAGDPYDNAQDLGQLLGKILRIDVDSRDAGEYGIPSDNPFADTGTVIVSDQASELAQTGAYHPDARREICNWGLRNPWQFGFDSQTGDLFVADVGQNLWEEVNFLPAGSVCGHNLGWDFDEGAYCYGPNQQGCSQVGMLPVENNSHAGGDCSITGIGVYRGQAAASLDGIYFFSDYCSGRIYGLQRDASGTWQTQDLLDTTLQVTGSGQDISGELYVTTCTCEYGRDYQPYNNPTGELWRVVAADQVPSGATVAPTGTAAALQPSTPVSEGSEATPEASATPAQ